MQPERRSTGIKEGEERKRKREGIKQVEQRCFVSARGIKRKGRARVEEEESRASRATSALWC